MVVQIPDPKTLVVSLHDGTVGRHKFIRWVTEDGELSIWGPDGELCAVYAEGFWGKALVESSSPEPETEDDDVAVSILSEVR